MKVKLIDTDTERERVPRTERERDEEIWAKAMETERSCVVWSVQESL